jgi:peptidoglycan hydrolase-like protein with peptidoglycan-binding domain
MKARHIILLSGLLWLWPIFFAAGDPSRQGTPPVTQDKLLSAGDILIVQQHLAELHFNPGPVDGVWHPATTTALRTFQQRYGLPATGELDVATRRELHAPPSGGGGNGR